MAEQLSVERLSRGEPAQLIGASRPRALITTVHGGETLGPRTFYLICTEAHELLAQVDYVHLNPRAAALGQRHVGHDQNRAFGRVPIGASQAEIRARQRARFIEGLISSRGYEYTLDLHTSDTKTEGFVLISKRNEVRDNIISKSVLKNVAVMPPTLIEDTLMGAVPQAVAIEYARADEGRDAEECVGLIERLLAGKDTAPKERRFFNVNREITKDEDPGDVPNFEWCDDGYYPILLGREGDTHSYRNDPDTNLLCFAADTAERVIL